jgi:CMP/dCMP kinase
MQQPSHPTAEPSSHPSSHASPQAAPSASPHPTEGYPARWRIALDGPAASGKTTVARRLAQVLGYALLDTGAMYRAVALEGLARGVAAEAVASMEALAVEVAATFELLPDRHGKEGFRLLVRGQDVTPRLHDAAVNVLVPRVAAMPGVRRELTVRQRELGLRGAVVMTGRDIGTVVLPEAEVKVFMTAEAGERARRRVLDMLARGEGQGRSQEELYAEVLASIVERDAWDTSRADAPLVQAADALPLDTTHLSQDEVIARILAMVAERYRAASAPQRA